LAQSVEGVTTVDLPTFINSEVRESATWPVRRPPADRHGQLIDNLLQRHSRLELDGGDHGALSHFTGLLAVKFAGFYTNLP
jgi:hypothetical protein